MKRLVDFQATLEEERGLPQTRWLASLERGEACDRTQMRSRSREWREMVDAEASSPTLRGGSGEMERVQQ